MLGACLGCCQKAPCQKAANEDVEAGGRRGGVQSGWMMPLADWGGGWGRAQQTSVNPEESRT